MSQKDGERERDGQRPRSGENQQREKAKHIGKEKEDKDKSGVYFTGVKSQHASTGWKKSTKVFFFFKL